MMMRDLLPSLQFKRTQSDHESYVLSGLVEEWFIKHLH